MNAKLSAAVLAAGLALVPPAAARLAPAQEGLARRVEQVRDGEVHFSFAAREGVCGHESGISFRNDRDGRSYTRWNSDWDDRDCVEGPVHVALRIEGGRVTDIDTRVASGFPGRGGRVTDLGRVGAPEAARYLLSLAERLDDGDAGEDALAPAALADSVDIGPELLRLARREGLPRDTRTGAVFWLSQVDEDAAARGLEQLAVDRGTDREVRESAVFWLGQSGSDHALEVIERVLRDRGDRELQKKAVFALSQHRSPRAHQLLREYAEAAGEPAEVRQDAIFWLGQSKSDENARYLRDLFRRLDDEGELKDKVIFSLSQMRGVGNERWLLDVARDRSESMQVRKQALFWAGQSGAPLADLARLYDDVDDREMKEQIVFVLSQRRDEAALEKLMDIARRDADKEMREKALFWLGQSRDPRALRFLAELINQ